MLSKIKVKMRASLWFFFALYLILPEYFALEISSSIPLLTGSRIILVIMILVCIHKRTINIKLDRAFLAYFIILLIVNLYHLSTNPSTAIKAIFTLIVEQAVLYIVMKNLIKSKDVWYKGMDIMVSVSGIVSILGFFEAISGINVFYYLTTTSRDMLQASYERLGSLRAESAFGHPVYFAVYLLSMLPFALYFYENTAKKRYLLIGGLNICALFASGTRGGVVVLAVLLLSFVFFKKKGTKKRYLKPFVALLPVAAIALAIFPEFFSYAGNLISSVFYALGISTSEVSDFGNNVSGLASRTMQFSGLTWAKEHNALLLGFGPEAHVNKLIAYRNYLTGRWNTLSTIDCGYIGYILLYGIVGTVGYVIMYISAVKKSIVRSDENERSNIFNAYKYFYIAYFVGLLSSVGLDSLFFVFYFMMLIYIELDKKECKNQAGSLYT